MILWEKRLFDDYIKGTTATVTSNESDVALATAATVARWVIWYNSDFNFVNKFYQGRQ